MQRNPSPSPPPFPRFVRLSLANLAAQSAEQLSLATVPLVAVLALGSSVGDIGLLTAIGLSCKNAILIVEFASLAQQKGRSAAEAALARHISAVQ